MKQWKRILDATTTQKQAEIAILFSDTENFKPKLIRRDKSSYYILLNGTILQEEIIIVNMCIKYWCSKFNQTETTRQKRTDGLRYNHSKEPQYPTVTNRSNRQKINKYQFKTYH